MHKDSNGTQPITPFAKMVPRLTFPLKLRVNWSIHIKKNFSSLSPPSPRDLPLLSLSSHQHNPLRPQNHVTASTNGFRGSRQAKPTKFRSFTRRKTPRPEKLENSSFVPATSGPPNQVGFEALDPSNLVEPLVFKINGRTRRTDAVFVLVFELPASISHNLF